MFEICSTSLVALIQNFPLFCNFPLRFCNFPMSMSTNDVEQISNNRVINQESHVYFVKFGINLHRSFFKNFKSPSLCSGRFPKFQKTNFVNLSQISLITMWLHICLSDWCVCMFNETLPNSKCRCVSPKRLKMFYFLITTKHLEDIILYLYSLLRIGINHFRK